jgi:transposase-like protein
MQEKGRKGQGGLDPLFEESLKIAVAREYLTGQLSYSQLAKKYGLPSGDTARYFVKWYKQWLSKQENKPDIEPVENSKETLDLAKQLKQANLRITALEMLIQNAERELGVDIIKKSGTKQQGK